ncbi:MAG: nucleotidyltransferase domain-containing protein [Ignavibacteriae bacterium]|nr:nucleotidyltransferase domain-containing protein [Ignavibacteriota bacterium]
MSKQQTIERLREFLKDKPVLRAYLFGSYARGDVEDGSDIDILVDLDYSCPIGMEFIQIHLDLEDLVGRKVDLVSSRALSKYVRPFVDREKELFYEGRN